MGSVEKVCTIHIYKHVVVVKQISLSCNDSETLVGRLRGLSDWKYVMLVYWSWMGDSVVCSAFCS